MSYVTSKIIKDKKTGKEKKVWLARWKEQGKERQKQFNTRKDAKQHAHEMAMLSKKSTYSGDVLDPRARLRFRQVVVMFLREKRDGTFKKDPLETVTLREYASLFRHHILPFIEYPIIQISCDEIDEEMIEAMAEYLHKNGRSFDRIKRSVTLLCSVLKWAHKNKLRQHPAPSIELEKKDSVKRAEAEKAEEFFTVEQVQTLLVAADDLAKSKNRSTRNAWQAYRPMLYFVALTGARVSEARALRKKDIDLANGKVMIRQTADEKGNIKHPKSIYGRRDIPLDAALLEVLEPYLETVKGKLAFGSANDTPRAINNLHRRMMEPLIAHANKMAKAHGIARVPPYKFHALRHSYASRLIANKFNIKQIQVWMGHHDPAFTLRVYVHLFNGDTDVEDYSSRMAIPRVVVPLAA